MLKFPWDIYDHDMHCMKLRCCFKELIVSLRRKLNNIEIIFLLEDCVIMDNIMLTQLEICAGN